MDFGELLAEGGEQGGQVALGRDGACRNRQVARDARVEAAEALSRLLVQVEDSPGQLIEPLARLGQSDATGPAVEERDPELFLKGRDSLTHRGLGHAQVGRRVREAPPLGRPRERREVRELSGARLLVCFSTTGADAQIVIGQTHGIHSAVLNEKRNYRLYLPDSYAWAKDRRYPVLYVLDGESEFLHTAVSVGYLAVHGEIPELVVVELDSTVRVRDFSPTDWPEVWVGGGGAGNPMPMTAWLTVTRRPDSGRMLYRHQREPSH